MLGRHYEVAAAAAGSKERGKGGIQQHERRGQRQLGLQLMIIFIINLSADYILIDR